ncbi:putative protein isoform X1 [Capsicum chacoense]|nr:putative alpha-dioxygenase 1-like [Capsicum annuum]
MTRNVRTEWDGVPLNVNHSYGPSNSTTYQEDDDLDETIARFSTQMTLLTKPSSYYVGQGGQLQEQYNHVQEEDANYVSHYQGGPNQQRTNYQGGQFHNHNQRRPIQRYSNEGWNNQQRDQGWSADNQGNRRVGSSQAYSSSRAPMYQQGNQSPPYHIQGWNNQQTNQGWSANNQGNKRASFSHAYNASRAPTYQQGNQSPPYHNQGWNNQQYNQGWSANNQGNMGAGSSRAYSVSRVPMYQQGNQSPPHHNQGWSANNQLDNFLPDPPVSTYCRHAFLNFDGASKGNPGLAGVGAVLRAADGSMVFWLRKGLGIATNNVAEYRGLFLGLEYALEKGFKHIQVQGDSKLVCNQTRGIWETKNQRIMELSNTVQELKDHFRSFLISHVERELNTEADTQAKLAVYLEDGETQVDVD